MTEINEMQLLYQQFVLRNPQVKSDPEMAKKVWDLDNVLAKIYKLRNEEHLIGTSNYVLELESYYRRSFIREPYKRTDFKPVDMGSNDSIICADSGGDYGGHADGDGSCADGSGGCD